MPYILPILKLQRNMIKSNIGKMKVTSGGEQTQG